MKYSTIIMLTLFMSNCQITKDLTKAEIYMNEVVTEKYKEVFLPDLEPTDIPYLLKYSTDTKILKKHPVNPISSFSGDGITVGIIALWTIESIRICELNGDNDKFNRFPSLNPIIIDTSYNNIYKTVPLDTISNIYYNWWNDNTYSETEKISINPLKATSFKWR